MIIFIVNNNSVFLLLRLIFFVIKKPGHLKSLHFCLSLYTFQLLSLITSILSVYHIFVIVCTYGIAKPRHYSCCNMLHCTTPKLLQHLHVIGTAICYWIFGFVFTFLLPFSTRRLNESVDTTLPFFSSAAVSEICETFLEFSPR